MRHASLTGTAARREILARWLALAGPVSTDEVRARYEFPTEWIEERYPDAGPLVGTETCIYTTTIDQRFILTRRGRIVIGSACSGHGFKFAPAVGERLADLVADIL